MAALLAEITVCVRTSGAGSTPRRIALRLPYSSDPTYVGALGSCLLPPFGPAPLPFVFTTYSIVLSGEIATADGFQPTGMCDTTCIVPASITPTALIPDS